VSLNLEVQVESEGEWIPPEDELQRWAVAALEQDGTGAELVIRVVNREESRRFNHDYRGKDKPTNVLSFPFEAPPGVSTNHLGDLLVCAPVVAAEAAAQKKRLAHHWAHMIVHGVLHLRGYDHIDEEDARQMESLECSLLQDMGISDPYQEGYE
jgi:probable rRNA maturation factor